MEQMISNRDTIQEFLTRRRQDTLCKETCQRLEGTLYRPPPVYVRLIQRLAQSYG